MNTITQFSSKSLIDTNTINALVKALNRALDLQDNIPPTDYILGIFDYSLNQQETRVCRIFDPDESNSTHLLCYQKIKNTNNTLLNWYFSFVNKRSPKDPSNGCVLRDKNKVCVVNFSTDTDINKMIALVYLTFLSAETSIHIKNNFTQTIEMHIDSKVVTFKSDYKTNQILKNILKFFVEQVE